MRPKAPRVWEDLWRGTAAVENGPQLDTPAWLVWLEDPATTRFAYPVTNWAQGYIEGFMTLRKEARVRGGVYWTAYWRVDGRLRKVYLGHATAVTAPRLRAIAAAWLAHRALAAALSLPPGARGDPRPRLCDSRHIVGGSRRVYHFYPGRPSICKSAPTSAAPLWLGHALCRR